MKTSTRANGPPRQERTATGGINLLSPTMREVITSSTAMSSSRVVTNTPVKKPNASSASSSTSTSSTTTTSSPSPPLSNNSINQTQDEPAAKATKKSSKVTTFDFDGFTLASVRTREEKEQEEQEFLAAQRESREAISKFQYLARPHDNQNLSGTSYKTSSSVSSTSQREMEMLTSSFRSSKSNDEFEFERRRLLSSNSSTNNQQPFSHPSLRRVSVNQQTLSIGSDDGSSTTGSASGGVSRKAANILMKGWLQRRKGAILKRWKPHYCVLKDDDYLCLYSNEDTVNGKLEHRLQVLRVMLTDTTDSFHVVGVGSDGTPRKEEFRAGFSMDWRNWFRAFRDFLDETSLNEMLARKPEMMVHLRSPAMSSSQRSNRRGGRGGQSDATSQDIDELSASMDGAGFSPSLHRQSFMRKSCDRSIPDDQRSVRSTLSSFSTSSGDHPNNQLSEDGGDIRCNNHNHKSSDHHPHKHRHYQRGNNQETHDSLNQKPEADAASDCPMIERESQVPLAILEQRGSVTDSDGSNNHISNITTSTTTTSTTKQQAKMPFSSK